MPELRWILVLAGVFLVVLVYAWGKRGGAAKRAAGDAPSRIEPRLDDGAPAASRRLGESPPAHEDPVRSGGDDAAPDESKPEAEKVIILHVSARGADKFQGSELFGAMRAESLRYGRHDIFHRYLQEESSLVDPNPVFSVANMVEPGTFDLNSSADERYQGITMFLALPGPTDPVAAFADMLATGRRLAATLGGELLDQTGSTVSRQSASHIREEIINFRHGIKVAHPEPRP